MFCRFVSISLLQNIKPERYDKKMKNKSKHIENYVKFAKN